MARHDHRRHIEISDGERVVAAEVATGGPEEAARVSLRAEAGHITPVRRARLIDAVLNLPEVQDSARLQATLPLGDPESLNRLQEKCEDVETRPAGASALLTANLPAHAARSRPQEAPGDETPASRET